MHSGTRFLDRLGKGECMDFWEIHSGLFLVSMFFFPRLTLIFATAAPFGVWHWLGWFFTPRILGAILATVYYGGSNPTVCILAWIFGILGNIMGAVAGRIILSELR